MRNSEFVRSATPKLKRPQGISGLGISWFSGDSSTFACGNLEIWVQSPPPANILQTQTADRRKTINPVNRAESGCGLLWPQYSMELRHSR